MTEGMEALTVKALGLALDAAGLRQQAIAANIANANTEGYAPLTVDFEQQIAHARNALQTAGRLDMASLAQVNPRVTPAVDGTGLPVRIQLDAEVAKLSQNAVHYQALIKGLNRHYQLMSSAVSDGKK
jgi:flagellar basal-body rod protein FlgB